ncbi:Uncharacterised protein [Mycobacteroides abscessus subsp. abscessus]|nr:Uncharacterised protein [Mycobacteroides abscessus subsp. abscessus]
MRAAIAMPSMKAGIGHTCALASSQFRVAASTANSTMLPVCVIANVPPRAR